MKNNGMTGPKDIPDRWSWSTIGELCTAFAGYGFPKHLQGKLTGDIPFFKVGDISKNWQQNLKYLTEANNYLSIEEARFIKAKPLPSSTPVFAKIGAAMG